MTRRAAVKQADVARVAKALASAGVRIIGADLRPDGTVRLFTPDATPSPVEKTREIVL